MKAALKEYKMRVKIQTKEKLTKARNKEGDETEGWK